MNRIKYIFLRRENTAGELDVKGLWVIVIVRPSTVCKITPRNSIGWRKRTSATENLLKELKWLGEYPDRWCPKPSRAPNVQFWGRLEA